MTKVLIAISPAGLIGAAAAAAADAAAMATMTGHLSLPRTSGRGPIHERL